MVFPPSTPQRCEPDEHPEGVVGDSPVARGAPVSGQLSGKLAGLSLPRQVLVLAIWPFLELLLNSLVGVVDTALAGRIDEASLDAIGVAAYVSWLLGMLFTAVGTGAAALISRAVGSGRMARANLSLAQALLLALVWGTATAGAVAWAAPLIVGLFQLPGAAHELAVVYLRVVAAGAGFGAVMLVGNACLRSAGDTRTPFVLMVVVNVVNTVVSVLLTFGPGPLGGHGVAGIAAGTAAAWLIGAMGVVAVLVSGRFPLRLHPRWLRPRWGLVRRIVRVGLPSLIESSGMWIGNAIIGGFVGALMARTGTQGMMGAHIIGIRIESLSFLPGVAIGIAAATLMGQYLGAGRPDMAARAARLCWALASGIMSVLGLAFILIPGWFAGLLAPGDEMQQVRDMAVPLLRICGPIQFFFGTYLVLSHALRGAGDTKGPMVITYASTFLVRLPAAYILAIPLGYGLTGVWFGLCGELVVRGVLYYLRFRAGRWRTIEV